MQRIEKEEEEIATNISRPFERELSHLAQEELCSAQIVTLSTDPNPRGVRAEHEKSCLVLEGEND